MIDTWRSGIDALPKFIGSMKELEPSQGFYQTQRSGSGMSRVVVQILEPDYSIYLYLGQVTLSSLCFSFVIRNIIMISFLFSIGRFEA